MRYRSEILSTQKVIWYELSPPPSYIFLSQDIKEEKHMMMSFLANGKGGKRIGKLVEE